MYSYFVRHTRDLGIPNKTIDELYNQDKMGIHYPHVTTDDPITVPDFTSINVDDCARAHGI